MNKKIFILIIIFFMTGCWNYQELNSLAVTTAIAIDLTDEDEYEVSLMVANSRKAQANTQENESQTVIYSGKGKTITEAFKDIDLLNPRQSYIGHVSVIVISEDIAYKGMENIIDFFARNSESTKRFQMALAKDAKAKDIIKILTPLETFSAQNISDNIQASDESQATSTSILYSDYIYLLMEKGINPILPSVVLIGDKKDGSKDKSLQQTIPDAFIKLGNIAVFNDYKLLGYVTRNESKGINLLRDSIEEMTLYLESENKNIVIKLLESKTKTKLELKNNKPVINIYISCVGTIIEDNLKHNLTNEKTIQKIQKMANKELKELAVKGLNSAKNYKSDIFGYGNLVYKNYPNYYKKIDNWDKDVFPNLEVNIHTNVSLKSKGSAKQAIKEVVDEN